MDTLPPAKIVRHDDGTVDHLDENGYMYLEAKDSTLQQNLASLLRANYNFVAKRRTACQISGGKTLQTKVDVDRPTFAASVLQVVVNMLLERVKESVSAHFAFSSTQHTPDKLRITNCCFVMTKGDDKGQIPHCDALSTNFLTGLVYLSDGTRGTEYWPKQTFTDLPRNKLFDTNVPLLKKVYGEAIALTSDELLDAFVPVRDRVAFGDMLVFSPSLLHRGPPSIQERLCFFFSIESVDGEGGQYDADAQNTIDDIALRCFHFDTDEFLTCHDDWLAKQNFAMSYRDDIEDHVGAAYTKWQEWVAAGRPSTTNTFFSEEGKRVLSEAYQCWRD